MPGIKAWEVFGEMDIHGFDNAVAKLGAFDAAAQTTTAKTARLTASAAAATAKFTALTGALSALGAATEGAAVKSFANFDEAMQESLAIMDVTSKTMREDMASAARRMATQTAFSSKEVAEGYFFLASAGLDAEQSLAAIGEVARFAQAGNFDLALATELATDAQSALGLTAEDATKNLQNLKRVQDVLVAANQQANATVEEFSQALTNKVAARARITGKSVEEVVAVLAALADQGEKGQRAGQRLNIVMRDLARFAQKNSEAFEDAGIQVFDATGEMRNMADIVADVENTLGDMNAEARTAELRQLGLTRRSQDVLNMLIGLSDEIREYQDNLEQAGGATDEVANKQLDTLNKQFGLLGSTIKRFFRDFGDNARDLIEPTRDMRDAVNTLRRDWNRFFSDTNHSIDSLASSMDKLAGDIEDNSLQILSWIRQLQTFFATITFLFETAINIIEIFANLLDTILVGLRAGMQRVILDVAKMWNNMVRVFNKVSPINAQTIPTDELQEGVRNLALQGRKDLKDLAGDAIDVKNDFEDLTDSIDRATEAVAMADYEHLIRSDDQGGGGAGFGLPFLPWNTPGEMATSIVKSTREAFKEAKRRIQAGEALGDGGGGAGGAAAFSIPVDLDVRNANEIAAEVRDQLGQLPSQPVPTTGFQGFNQTARETMGQTMQQGPFFSTSAGGVLGQQAEKHAENEGESAGRSFMESMGQELKRGAGRAMQSLLSGLIKGKQDIEDTLINIGISLASSLLTGGLFGALGIASPSAEARWAGQQVGHGLVQGMNDMMGPVGRAADRIGRAAAPNAQAVRAATQRRAVGIQRRAQQAGQGSGPFDFNDFPEAKDPLSMRRDRVWKRFLRGSLEVLSDEGAKF